MFDADIYIHRRNQLKQQIQSGLILFLGNQESPMNYPDNPYPFRQDSSFLYFWGLDFPGLAGIIDVDEDEEIILGDDFTMDDIIWMGPQSTLNEKCQGAGVSKSVPYNHLEEIIKTAINQSRTIHFIPQYRADNILKLANLLKISSLEINNQVSTNLIKAVVSQREIKSKEEVEQIEAALEIAYEMQTLAMKMSGPGLVEREVSGAMEGLVSSKGGLVAFPIIFSVHGETLHNHFHGNLMQAGDIAVNDSGGESVLHYASDITRTIPVSGKFTERQKDIYQLVLSIQESAIKAIKPGVQYKDIHLLASRKLASGMKDLGFMKGNVDDAIAAGAHGLFFPHGLGHQMGLDVHDMEDLGEDFVGYTEELKRSSQFGLSALRLAKTLLPGFVVTVEPGIYFIPELIDRWKSENKFTEFINYDRVEQYKDFGGIRLEDDVLVEKGGYRVLGKPIPKTIAEVEQVASN